MRPRREVSAVTLWLLRPLFRRCWARDAWILRVVGNRRGPVLVLKGIEPKLEDLPERSSQDSSPPRSFARLFEHKRQLGEDGRAGV